MDLNNILQDSIIKISPQNFLNRLVLFNLISDKEIITLQNRAWQQQHKNKDIYTVASFIRQKLNNQNAVYHERFKFFLGYYSDLKPIYRNWEILGKTFSI